MSTAQSPAQERPKHDGYAGSLTMGGALCIVRGEFTCDICGRTLPKQAANQKRCGGECSVIAKRRLEQRRNALKERRWGRPA